LLLRSRGFARNTPWLAAIEEAADKLEHPEWMTEARKELASLYPRSTAARDLEWSERDKTNPAEADLVVSHEWPGSLGLAYFTFLAVMRERSSTPQQIGDALELLKLGLKNEPEALLTLPPVPIDIAASLAERGVRYGDIPDLVRLGFTLTERSYVASSRSDLFANAAKSAQQRRDDWYLEGYFPLCEANIRLGHLPNARDTNDNRGRHAEPDTPDRGSNQ
jgi:hypothetical protein